MRHRRRRNPTELDWLLILGGAAAVGLTIYLVSKPAAAALPQPATPLPNPSPNPTQ